jgi:hypothetical protein
MQPSTFLCSGKTTLLFQYAHNHLLDHPDDTVLVITKRQRLEGSPPLLPQVRLSNNLLCFPPWTAMNISSCGAKGRYERAGGLEAMTSAALGSGNDEAPGVSMSMRRNISVDQPNDPHSKL